ncbi:MAG: hypothetical protein JXR07_15100 [Reichenbachiella sp.]
MKKLSVVLTLVLTAYMSWSCTIFSAQDNHGQMWTGNNEDFYWYNFSTHLKIVTKTDSSLAYFFFDYPGNNFPQGGSNEAGLFFDANLIEASEIRNISNKKAFPGSSSDMMFHMLGRCTSVIEAVDFFDTYALSEIKNAQIHLADKQGNKGIITADSSWVTRDKFQVSTNYNLCHKDDDYKKCWRYPIATSILNNVEPSFEVFSSICDSTAQRLGAFTIYSNVHNLSTGEMWLYYAWDYDTPYKTSFDSLTELGDTTILLRDFFPKQPVIQAYNKYRSSGFQSCLKELSTINDVVSRKEKLKLISLDALFSFDTLLRTGKIKATQDDKLISEIIDASDDKEILMLITNQEVSQRNRELAKKKLRRFQKSQSDEIMIWLIVMSIGISAFLAFAFKRKMKRQLTNDMSAGRSVGKGSSRVFGRLVDCAMRLIVNQ